jgi:hypothetical protein
VGENDGTNGSGAHGGGGGEGGGDETLGRWVAGRLMGLIGEMHENSRRARVIETRLDGLARVLLRDIPFAHEHLEKVADVTEEAAKLEHAQGEALYVAAQDFRARAKTHH